MKQTLRAVLSGVAILLVSGASVLAQATITIIVTPPGNAPLWVREAWVGLILPLGPEVCDLILVKDDPSHSSLRYDTVPQDIAIQLLKKKSPTAAAWWSEHGYPKKGNLGYFCFPHYTEA